MICNDAGLVDDIVPCRDEAVGKIQLLLAILHLGPVSSAGFHRCAPNRIASRKKVRDLVPSVGQVRMSQQGGFAEGKQQALPPIPVILYLAGQQSQLLLLDRKSTRLNSSH